MTPREALIELLARVGASHGTPVFIGAQELGEWPAAAIAAMKSAKLLLRARPAESVVCPGCERACVMPAQVIPGQGSGGSGAFVICDKRSDINRVSVPIDLLEQWQASGASLAGCLARLLDLRQPPGTDVSTGRWEVGMLRGARYASHLVLLADGDLKLTLAGHSMVLADVLDLQNDHITLDRRSMHRCIDSPVAGAGDRQSSEQRRERLRARVREEEAKGKREFLKPVAEEEGISVSRLKQLIRRKRDPSKAKTGPTRPLPEAPPRRGRKSELRP